ncbi:TIGR02680 family protein [Saccharopolyspora sp. MS10]|uniref:TIGR02680 family protein n=1 Tax=Saccharopolyspora sp. MS10 TaxID=3385973 RepID=UPI00399EF7FF
MTAPRTSPRAGRWRAGTTSRWRPSRAGILNVWRYYDEVFEFHSGRLLLRGPNGTGKSKALELLLPFLFDANLRANRLSTFGSSERTMHWNLMGEGAAGATRVGYVWLEFRGGPGEWFCCGARLQASKHTSEVRADFFTTTARIGAEDGVELVNGSGQPLARAALAEALEGRGALHESAAAYREAVRAALFPGLTEQRFDALITALLQLRTPKLSERLDPNLLSTLLSRALPPLGRTEIAELAEGFERLDRRRERLTSLDGQVGAAELVAGRQRDYARRVLRAAAERVLVASAELDRREAAVEDAGRRHEDALADREAGRARETELVRETERLRARLAVGGEPVRTEADEARRRADELRALAAERAARADEAAGLAERAGLRASAAAAAEDAAERDARRHADRIGLAGAFAEVAGTTDRQRTRLLLRAAVRGGHDRVAEVRAGLERRDRAVAARADAERELDRARAELGAAAERLAELGERGAAAVAERVERLREWAARLAELSAEPAEFAEPVESRADLLERLRPRYLAAAAELDRRAAGVDVRRGELRERHAELDAHRASLRERTDLPPAAPATRTADRAGRPGAPLWRLVAFRNGVPAEVRAGVEAALEGAGLLDAWVTPGGHPDSAGSPEFAGSLAFDGHDSALDPARLRPVDGPSLVEVLRPESAGPVDRDRIWQVLHGIGYGPLDAGGGRHRGPEPDVAVAPDGRWRVGGLEGSWGRAEAAHIGGTERDRARRQRLAEVERELGELGGELAALDAEAADLAHRREALDAEWDAIPPDAAVREARRAEDVAEAAVAARDDAVSARVEQVARAAEDARLAGVRLTELAGEHGLPADRAALDGLDRAVEAFTGVAEIWLDARSGTAEARRAAADAARLAELARELAAGTEEHSADVELAALRLGERQRALGLEQEQAAEESAAASSRLVELDAQRARLAGELLDLAERIGALAAERAAATTGRDAARAELDTATARLRARLADGFGADAGAALEPSAVDDDPVGAARELAATWAAEPHGPADLAAALGELGEAVYDGRHVLAGRADLELRPEDEVQVCTAALDGDRVGASALRDVLRAERDRARRELDEAERDLFDRTLTGETRRHLAARIRQAGELVDTMNTRLKRVRTASKVAVQLVWEVDPNLPASTRAARDLLLADPVRLTEADREALRAFFRERLAEAGSEGAVAGWEGRLAQVFDYTAWHRFGVRIDRAGGAGWQLLTKRLHGALSGGEKAIALHLPLFAAVAAHYQSVPSAPRFILLDEVFVGVDTTNRGQVFDLLAALDLDLVLTSDHEWCTYQELDGIAIHQLITGDGDDAVTTARFVWDGRALAEERGAP